MPFTILPIALVLAGLCTLINLWLSIRTGQVRGREKISIGDGGSEPLIRRMRAQANFIENAPLVVVLVALVELCTGTSLVLAVLALLFVVARIAHAFGMDGWGPGRMAGTGATMLIQLVLAVWAIAIPIVAHHDMQRTQPSETIVPVG